MESGGPSSDSMKTTAWAQNGSAKAPFASFEDPAMSSMRDRIAAIKKKVADDHKKGGYERECHAESMTH